MRAHRQAGAADPPPSSTRTRRSLRRDGQASRERIVRSALQLFAEHGFAKTSTRQIAQAADVNVAALHYHFGDKAALYRAAFAGPSGLECSAHRAAVEFSQGNPPLEHAMRRLFTDFLAPLGLGEEFRWVLRLHFREMVEPTGVWQEEIDNEIKPLHEALLRLLCRELGRRQPDLDMQRLAIAVLGMAVHFFVAHDVIAQIAPRVLHDAAAVQTLADRLAGYACDLIRGEARRRAALARAKERQT